MAEILYNEKEGILKISGNSYYENAMEFYKPVIDWLKAQVKTYPKRKISIVFCMEYYNTSTSRRFLEMFDILEAHQQNGGKSEVKWYHTPDDLDMRENGADYAEEFNFDFIFETFSREAT